MTDDATEPERPRVEPEIIPPDRAGRPADWRQPSSPRYGASGAAGTHRIYVARLGPFGATLLMLVFAILVAIMFLAIVGAALIWLPIIALVVVVAAIYRHLLR